MATYAKTNDLPGAGLDVSKMPGHWLFAQMGKKVLRPGGRELTAKMLEALAINTSDALVEFAPGLGATTQLALAANPASYVGVDRDANAAKIVAKYLRPGDRCIQATASETGLEDASKTVVWGEAMLSMQTENQKKKIIAEAHRILKPGGRYAIHELGLQPDDIPEALQATILKELSGSIHVGARPLTLGQWRQMLHDAGFDVVYTATAPMRLLEPSRIIADEGFLGAMRFMGNVLKNAPIRQRVLEMRSVFKRYEAHLNGVALVAVKR